MRHWNAYLKYVSNSKQINKIVQYPNFETDGEIEESASSNKSSKTRALENG